MVVPSWFSTTVEVRWVTEPSSFMMVSDVVLALYSTWMSLVVVYPLYVAYTVMSPDWIMVIVPSFPMVALAFPDVMLQVGVTTAPL